MKEITEEKEEEDFWSSDHHPVIPSSWLTPVTSHVERLLKLAAEWQFQLTSSAADWISATGFEPGNSLIGTAFVIKLLDALGNKRMFPRFMQCIQTRSFFLLPRCPLFPPTLSSHWCCFWDFLLDSRIKFAKLSLAINWTPLVTVNCGANRKTRSHLILSLVSICQQPLVHCCHHHKHHQRHRRRRRHWRSHCHHLIPRHLHPHLLTKRDHHQLRNQEY